MRFTKVIIGEMILLIASVFVFRSLWLLLDEYLGYSNLLVMLVIGLVFTAIGLYILNYGVKCELEKNQKA